MQCLEELCGISTFVANLIHLMVVIAVTDEVFPLLPAADVLAADVLDPLTGGCREYHLGMESSSSS